MYAIFRHHFSVPHSIPPFSKHKHDASAVWTIFFYWDARLNQQLRFIWIKCSIGNSKQLPKLCNTHTHIQIAIEETCIQKQTHTHRDMHMYTHTIRAGIESINTTKIIGIIIDSQNNWIFIPSPCVYRILMWSLHISHEHYGITSSEIFLRGARPPVIVDDVFCLFSMHCIYRR